MILRIMESMPLDTLKERKGEARVSQLSILKQSVKVKMTSR